MTNNAPLTTHDFNSQPAQVLRRLKHSPITPMEALRELGVLRLAAVVHALREEGHVITTEMLKVPKRTGGTARVARYHLEA